MTGCADEQHDDAYYAKVHTVTLLPKETKDPRAMPPLPPYYQFQIARGYVSGGSLPQSTLLEIKALYPGLRRFTPLLREVWYPKTGGTSFDVVKIFVRYSLDGQNNVTPAVVGRYEQGVKDGRYLNIQPPEELSRKIPSIRYFRGAKDEEKNDEHYAFRQPDGRVVTIDCLYVNQCHSFSTWHGKLGIEYYFNRARVVEMAEIDSAVNKLIDSFQPTLIQQGK